MSSHINVLPAFPPRRRRSSQYSFWVLHGAASGNRAPTSGFAPAAFTYLRNVESSTFDRCSVSETSLCGLPSRSPSSCWVRPADSRTDRRKSPACSILSSYTPAATPSGTILCSGPAGAYSEPNPDLSFADFIASLTARASAHFGDLMATMDAVLRKNPRIIFLTGAGASAPLGLPTMEHLLSTDFWKSVSPPVKKAIAFLGTEWSRQNREGLVDFEYVYTLADALSESTSDDILAYPLIRQVSVGFPGERNRYEFRDNFEAIRRAAVDLREDLRSQVHQKLRLSSDKINESAKIYSSLLEPIFPRLRAGTAISIFTTNYDRAIESIWQAGLHKDWLGPETVRLKRGFVGDETSPGQVWSVSGYDWEPTSKEYCVKLYKLHGSLNWRRQLGSVLEGPADEYTDESALIYPIRHSKNGLGEPFDQLFHYWRSELTAASDCVVIGSSLRDPLLLDELPGIISNENPGLRIWIVDRSPETVMANVPKSIHSRTNRVKASFGKANLGEFLTELLFDELRPVNEDYELPEESDNTGLGEDAPS